MLPYETLFQKILAKTSELEFDSFVIGVLNPEKHPKEVLQERYYSLKVYLGQTLCEYWGEKRTVDFLNPQARINVCPIAGTVDILLAPIYLAGRYLKLSREITSSHWIHHPCYGKGCEGCCYRGTRFELSIEDFLDRAIRPKFRSRDRKFHVMGREDIDVLMLGKGRPFVFEIYHPEKRNIDLQLILKELEPEPRAKINYLTYVDKFSVDHIKSTEPQKLYRASVQAEEKLAPNFIEKLAKLRGQVLAQQTPLRVMKRRADLVRQRTLYSLKIQEYGENWFVIDIQAESGTYIKELVSGDTGRTSPSFASILGQKMHCRQLDVLDILWEAPWEKGH